MLIMIELTLLRALHCTRSFSGKDRVNRVYLKQKLVMIFESTSNLLNNELKNHKNLNPVQNYSLLKK